ncbi:MAG TPA: nitroreductase family deazaflavin-dependent oxidoreductase [Solirubrobacterales bacterium]|jgi:deazaflavin-dependent oxidoreductase (nitroreductase family)|nr:nitroreductase family deazaflavin-dependent oxidoreductase [Solirubrobacterales bacterium]
MLSDRFVAKFSNTIGARGLRVIGRLNVPAYRLSGGRIGNKVGDGPVLLLTTTGRKSGESRTAPILYLAHGEAMILIDTNGGNEKLPGWSHNLRAKPLAEVEIGRRKVAVTARVAEGSERAELWSACVDQYAGFDDYVKWLKRTPSVWVLEPTTKARGEDDESHADIGTTRESAAAAGDTSPSDII